MNKAIIGLVVAMVAGGSGVSPLFAAASGGTPLPPVRFVEREAMGVYTNRRGVVTFDFGPERIGYLTVKGKRIGEGAGPVSEFKAKERDGLEGGDVVFHEAKSPVDMGGFAFECSDGNLGAFWADCVRLTENRLVAKRLGDEALTEKYRKELAETFAKAMPGEQEGANPLGVIVRKYLGIKADKEKRTVEVFPKLVQGMTRMAGTVPTALGKVAVDARHLRGNDFIVDVEIPAGARAARLVTPAWGESAEVDGKKLGVRSEELGVVTIDGKKRYAFRLGAGKHTVRLKAKTPNSSLLTSNFPAPATAYDLGKIQREKLDRGVVAVRDGKDAVVSWRYLPDDPRDIAFDVYENGRKLNEKPIAKATFFRTPLKRKGAVYEVAVAGEARREKALAPVVDKPYVKIPLKPMPEGYWTEEASVGDVDGDGRYELVVKRTPLEAKDNSQDGATRPTLLDCVTLDGRHLWRIDLGPNIRSGAHYTQFLVYDFDGDGKAEMICKTADGTVDGTGRIIGDAKARWANERGRVLDGPEYLTVFDGATGRAVCTVPYDPPRGTVADWGDDYGNRCDRFLACVANLDGRHPSAIFSRGYYAKTVIVAWDWDGKRLKKRWRFDSSTPGNEAYAGQGFHSLRAGDVDMDGRDEIVFGSMVVDDDGKGLYSTGFGHGDAQHLAQMSPHLRGMQQWTCQENRIDGLVLRYAGDGKVIWQQKRGYDVPRCAAADFDPTNPGYELWEGKDEPYWDIYGRELPGIEHIGWARDLVWWRGDMLRSRNLDAWKLYDYDWTNKTWKLDYILRTDFSNGTRKMSFPVLTADILGDWREEVVMPGDGGNSLNIFVSPRDTPYRFWTLMADPVYRIGVAGWNVAYNQSPQTSFYFGPDLLGHGIWFRGCYLP